MQGGTVETSIVLKEEGNGFKSQRFIVLPVHAQVFSETVKKTWLIG